MLLFRSTFWASLLLAGTLSCSKRSPAVAPLATPPTTPVATTFTNPLLAVGPDPWVYQKDGFYYYMHTTGNNVVLRKTAKMSELASAVSTTIWTAPATGLNSRNVWAPELHFLDGKWFVYYTAGPLNCCGGQRLWMLENANADPTVGTWTERGQLAVPGQDLWAIDGTILEQNGGRYLLWSGQEPNSNQQNIYICRMSSPTTLTGARVLLSAPQYGWELNGFPKVNEGPQVIHHGSKTVLVYSASHCSSDDYALGMLTAPASADPMMTASWTKSTTPIFVKNPSGQAFGPGHNGFFTSRTGNEDWIIYHANPQPGQGCGDTRNPRMQKFTWRADDTPDFGLPVPLGVPLPRPAGE